GSAFVGEKGTLILPHWADATLFPTEKFKDYKMPALEDINHYTGWAHACLGDGTTKSNFNYAGPLTEAVLQGMGVAEGVTAWQSGEPEIPGTPLPHGRISCRYCGL